MPIGLEFISSSDDDEVCANPPRALPWTPRKPVERRDDYPTADGRPLERYLAGLTEHAFLTTLGLAYTALVDYVSGLLMRFLRTDAVYLLHAGGRPLEEVPAMLRQAEPHAGGRGDPAEFYRHIGDFTLFWAGRYPEALHRASRNRTGDEFGVYCRSGKHSYAVAGSCEDVQCREESAVLRRLSAQFELWRSASTMWRSERRDGPGRSLS